MSLCQQSFCVSDTGHWSTEERMFNLSHKLVKQSDHNVRVCALMHVCMHVCTVLASIWVGVCVCVCACVCLFVH